MSESSSDTQTNSNSERENNLDTSEEFKSSNLVCFENPEFKDSVQSQSVREGESVEENNDSSSVGNYSGSSLFKMLKTVNSMYINSSQDDSDKGSNNDRNSLRRRMSRYSSLSRDSYHGKGNDDLNRSWLSDISEESPYPEMKGSIKKICNLGQGSEGEVYLCEISENDELVAYKEYSRRVKSYESLLEEFRLVHELDHENIVRYLYLQPPDIHREFGIVMEYMAGGSLQTYVQENFQNITFEDKIYLAKQILLGLAYLHENNIIHGDVKPGNILLSNDKKTVKIADFGMSFRVAQDNDVVTKFVGTPIFMSPEMLLEQICCKKSDIWSAGCCLYLLFTGQRPYTNFGKILTLESVIKSKSPLEACKKETLDYLKQHEGLCDFLNLCFVRDRDERPGAAMLLEHEIFN